MAKISSGERTDRVNVVVVKLKLEGLNIVSQLGLDGIHQEFVVVRIARAVNVKSHLRIEPQSPSGRVCLRISTYRISVRFLMALVPWCSGYVSFLSAPKVLQLEYMLKRDLRKRQPYGSRLLHDFIEARLW